MNKDYTLTTPAWARDFNNKPRHCWLLKDGSLALDQRAPQYNPQDGFGQPCPIPAAQHDPRLIGNPEWLRFIREVGGLLTEHDNPFASEGEFFLLNDNAHPTSDGRITYAETYIAPKPNSWGLRPVFRVFLANDSGWARIECYDEQLVGICEQALAAVEDSYHLVSA